MLSNNIRFAEPRYLDREIDINECPFIIEKPAMFQDWMDLTYIHWEVNAEDVKRHLPEDIEVDLIDNKAWITLAGFKARAIFPVIGHLPRIFDFPEVHLRTYVKTKDGTRAIWFISLDANHLGAVSVARASLNVPYFWSQVHMEKFDSSISYSSKRYFSKINTRVSIHCNIGNKLNPDEISEKEHLLTAQWVLLTRHFDKTLIVYAEHKPWPLYEAKLTHLNEELTEKYGLTPIDEPIVHFSPGVRAKVTLPKTYYG